MPNFVKLPCLDATDDEQLGTELHNMDFGFFSDT